MTTAQLVKEHQLLREVSQTVEQSLPGIEVLALELTGNERFDANYWLTRIENTPERVVAAV